MNIVESSLIHVVVPPKNSQRIHHPALILLHGRGADEEDLLGLSSALDGRLLVISVRAPYPFPMSGGYTWYEFLTVGTPEPTMFRTSYDKLTTFVNDALKNYPIDPRQVFLFGFSMGTVMSYALSLTLPQLFRGVIANSGYIPEGTHLAFRWNELSTVEFLITHGTLDPVIPIRFAQRARELLRTAGARFSYTEYPLAHQISDESLTDIAAWLQRRIDTTP